MKTAVKLLALCIALTPFVPAIGLGVATTVCRSWDILCMIAQGIAQAFAF